MCSVPSISVLLVTVGTGTGWSAGPIFLRRPHPGFAHFVAAAAHALTVPSAFRALPAFAAFAALTSSATLATHYTAYPALAARPVQL